MSVLTSETRVETAIPYRPCVSLPETPAFHEAREEAEMLRAVRAELRTVPTSDAGREAYRHEFQAAVELERAQR